MAGASGAYLALAISLYRFGRLGDSAIVYANIANLMARIIYCSIFIRRFTSKVGPSAGSGLKWSRTIPAVPVVFSCVVAGLVTRFSERSLQIDALAASAGRSALMTRVVAMHFSIGLISGLIILAIW